MIVTKDGYLARKTGGFGRSARRERRPAEVKKNYCDWWLVKHGSSNAGEIYLGGGIKLSLPAVMIGERVKFKRVKHTITPRERKPDVKR